MDVTLPNGKIIRGVPEGTSKDQIRQKAISSGLATAEDFGQPTQSQAPKIDMAAARKQALDEVASEQGPLDAFLIGAGKGFYDVGRGLGLLDSESESDAQAMEALREQRPYTTGAGEIAGQAAPFVPLGMGAAAGVKFLPGMAGMGGQVVAGGTVGAGEGAVLANASDQNMVQGAGVGAAIGSGAEILFPVLGRLGRSLYRKVTGKMPSGSMLDGAGRPTAELQSALDEAGLSIDDLTGDAEALIRNAQPNTDPRQLATAARFADEGIPVSKGELMQGDASFEQRTLENRMLESVADKQAEKFRQFKLTQSNAIRDSLEKSVNLDALPEDSGNLIKDALTDRKKLLRTQKNVLYSQALSAVDDVSELPLMIDSITSTLPDARSLRGLNRASGGKINEVMDTMAEYGLVPPREGMDAADIMPLSLQNFEEFNQILKGISRQDQSGATGKFIQPITEAVDDEVANLAETAQGLGLSESVIAPLREARLVVRQMKEEFNPKALAGQLTDMKRNSSEPVIFGSKVYSKLASKAQPVENVRKVMASLRQSGDKGTEAIANLQSTTMLDLIDAGFSTQSRQIDGIRTFNPIAFKRRLQALGEDKLDAIFQGNPGMAQRIKKMDKIAADLVPPSGAVPKGSTNMIGDLANRLGVMTLNAKFPGIGFASEWIKKISDNSGSLRAVREAMDAKPEVRKVISQIEREFPGIAAALGISGLSVMNDQAKDNDPNSDQ